MSKGHARHEEGADEANVECTLLKSLSAPSMVQYDTWTVSTRVCVAVVRRDVV